MLRIATLLIVASLMTVPIAFAEGEAEEPDDTQPDPMPDEPCVDVVPYPPYIVTREDC